MKKLVAMMLIALSTMQVKADEITVSDSLIDAMIQVESHGDDSAVGDRGKAIGCLQIWTIVVDDVNQVSSTKYSYDDRYDREKSIEICRKYLNRYGKHYQKKTGNAPSDEVLARIWNGGPSGWKIQKTQEYWEKVKQHVNS